jgi:hypothetical protein
MPTYELVARGSPVHVEFPHDAYSCQARRGGRALAA